jgi:hypothetical protein
MVGIIIAIIVVIALIVAFPPLGIGIGIILAVIIFFSYQSAKKQKLKEAKYKQFIQDTINQHPEFGNYKAFYGSDDTILILSEEGFYGFFRGYDFKSGSIYNIKNIKYAAEPFDRSTKKYTNALGKIIYRLEFYDFQSPITDLPFGTYQSGPDKAAKKAVFAEVKSTFDYIKKNSKNKNLSIAFNDDNNETGDDNGEDEE